MANKSSSEIAYLLKYITLTLTLNSIIIELKKLGKTLVIILIVTLTQILSTIEKSWKFSAN